MVMRKFIFFSIQVLFLCLVSMQSYAVTTEECENAETQETCPAGCYWYERSGCKICGTGTYTSESGQTSCKACIHPSGEEGKKWAWVANVEGNENAYCPFTISCAKDEYIDVTNVGESGGFGCKQCGSYYNSKEPGDYTITINNLLELLAAITNKNKENVCDGKVYKLDLQRNTWLLWWQDKVAYAKYGSGFASSETSTTWDKDYLPQSAVQGDRPIKTFKGYTSKEDCAGTMFFAREEQDGTVKAKFNNNWDALFGLADSAENTKRLYTCWDNLEVQILYFNPEGMTPDTWKTDKYTVNDDSEDGGFTVQGYGGLLPDGAIFESYSCTYVDESGVEKNCSTSTVLPEDDVLPDGREIHLKPKFADCPEGHFCSGADPQPCPSGTTSDPGAANDADCYMKAGDGGTKFCDGTGKCFYLPGNGKIPKNPSSDTTQNSAQSSTQNPAQ